MRFLTLLTGLALAASTVAQISTGQACPANPVSRFEACVCPYGTEFQYSTTWAILGVNAKDFSKYTSSCTYKPLRKAYLSFPKNSILILAFAPVYNLAWIGATNLTRNGIDHGPDKKVGTTRTFKQPTSVGTLTFTEKVRPLTPQNLVHAVFLIHHFFFSPYHRVFF